MKLITILIFLVCATVHLTTARSKHNRKIIQIRDEEKLGERLFKFRRSVDDPEEQDPQDEAMERGKRSSGRNTHNLAKTFSVSDLLKNDEEQIAKRHFHVKRSVDEKEEKEVEESRSKRTYVEELGNALGNLVELVKSTNKKREASGLVRDTREAVDDPVTSQQKFANIQQASSALTGIEKELEADPDSIEERTSQIINTLHTIMAQADQNDSKDKSKKKGNAKKKTRIQSIADRDAKLAKQVMMLVTKLEVAKYVAKEHAKEEIKKSMDRYGYPSTQTSPYAPSQYNPYSAQSYLPSTGYYQQPVSYQQNLYAPSGIYGATMQGAAKINMVHPATPVAHQTPLHPPSPISANTGSGMYSPRKLSPFQRANEQLNAYPVSNRMSNWQTFTMDNSPQYANYLESSMPYHNFMSSSFNNEETSHESSSESKSAFPAAGHVPLRIPSPLPRQAFYHSQKKPLAPKHTSATARHNNPRPEGYFTPPQSVYTAPASPSIYTSNPYTNMYSGYTGFGSQYPGYNSGATAYDGYYQPQQPAYYDPIIEKRRRKIESIKRAVAAVTSVESEIGLSPQTVYDLIDNVKKTALSHKKNLAQAVMEDEKKMKATKSHKVEEKLHDEEKEEGVAEATLTEVDTIEKILTMIEAAKYYAEMKAAKGLDDSNGQDIETLVAKRSVDGKDSDEQSKSNDKTSESEEQINTRESEEAEETNEQNETTPRYVVSPSPSKDDKATDVSKSTEANHEKESDSLFASIIKSVVTKGSEGLKLYEDTLQKDISEAEIAKQNIYDSIGKEEFKKAEEEAELIKSKLEKDQEKAFEEKKEIERAEKLAKMVKGKHLTTEDVESLKKDIVPKLKEFMMKLYTKRS